MQLTQKQLDDFNELYFKRFGERLSPQETLHQATSLVDMMKIIYRPLPKNKKDK